MRLPLLCTILAAFAALTFALPAPSDLSFEEAFIRHCSNGPSTRAGAVFTPRHPSETIWCVPNTRTYVILIVLAQVSGAPAAAIENLLATVAGGVQGTIDYSGDGNIARGTLVRDGPQGTRFAVTNANNHQVTYGVLGAAVKGLQDYMTTKGWAEVKFEVFDGWNQVGDGTVGTAD